MLAEFSVRPSTRWAILIAVMIAACGAVEALAGKTSVTASGRVVQIKRGIIVMRTESKKTLVIHADPKKRNRVSIKGPIRPAALVPGMILRFHGELKEGDIEEKISQVSVYSPADGYVPSILEDDGRTMITGRFKEVHRGKLIIEIGRRTLAAELSDEVKIELDSCDYRLIRPGDLIKVSGRPRRDRSITPRYVRVTRPPPQPKSAPHRKHRK